MVIKGGLQGQPGNPDDLSDEGVFISKINEGGCIHREYEDRLKVNSYTKYLKNKQLFFKLLSLKYSNLKVTG